MAIVCDAVTDCVAGSFVSTLRFSELLTERGHKVVFIASKSQKNPNDNYHKNIKVYRFPSFLLPKTEGQLYVAFPTVKKVKKILRDEAIDIVHIIIPTPSAVVALRSARALGIKAVAHSHTQPENLFLHLPIRILHAPLNYIFYKYLSWLYRQAEVIVYPTEFARVLLSKLKTNVKSIVISNGVDTAKFKKVDTTGFFNKFHISKNRTNILYVGRLHPEKSVDTLIKALPRVLFSNPDVHLLIAGFGHLGDGLVRLSEKLGVSDHVTFLGKVSDDELIRAYNVCDLFVLPSFAELEGMVVLEAMACGKPVIVANSNTSASTYFVNENGLLFEPGNEIDLSKKILSILRDKEALKRMGEESLKKSKLYDINESILKLEELYNSVLKI